jgi:hypothetical protein
MFFLATAMAVLYRFGKVLPTAGTDSPVTIFRIYPAKSLISTTTLAFSSGVYESLIARPANADPFRSPWMKGGKFFLLATLGADVDALL